MTVRFGLAFLSLSFASSAAAQSLTCDGAGERREISVRAPGEVGRACDLVVTRGDGSQSVPYNANNDAGYCAARIPDVVSLFSREGFACGEVTAATAPAPLETAALPPSPDPVAPAPQAPAPTPELAPAPAPVSDQPAGREVVTLSDFEIRPAAAAPAAEQVAAEMAEAPTVAPAAPVSPEIVEQPLAATPTDTAALAAIPTPAEVAASPFVALEPETAADAAAFDAASQQITPAPAEKVIRPQLAATGAPTSLTDGVSPSAARAPRPARPATGRLTGAAPTQDAPAPRIERVAAGALDVSPNGASKMRPAEDIIRGVLMSQAAAWNEGDIDAFMAGYWNSPDLQFVSGAEVAKGWKEVRNRYKARYPSPADMGILRFENISIEMVDSDVAVVVGRFALDGASGRSAGSFSLFMRQIDGLWRIVHDHTTEDAGLRDGPVADLKP